MVEKNILITGASSGIGKEISLYLAKQGTTVILIGRNEERLREIKEQIGDKAYTYVCDLNHTEKIRGIFDFCHENGLKLDGMVHSAGISEPMPVRSVSIQNVEETMRVNCMSFAELGKYFGGKRYSNEQASVVAISSLAATRPAMGQVSYAASKAALNSMVEVMSKEFLKRKIRVNAIMPSYVDTPMVAEGGRFGMNNGIDQMPLGVIEPIQIAYLTEFLLSDRSKYITGAAIPVSAGV